MVWVRRKIKQDIPTASDPFVKISLLELFTEYNIRSYSSDEEECDELVKMYEHLHNNWNIVMDYQMSKYDPLKKKYVGITVGGELPVIDFQTLVKDSLEHIAHKARR